MDSKDASPIEGEPSSDGDSGQTRSRGGGGLRRRAFKVPAPGYDTRRGLAKTRTAPATPRTKPAEARTSPSEARIQGLETRREPAESQGELGLRASELSYRRLFEEAKDGILILDVATGRINDVNPFLFGLLGLSRQEMLGKTVGELSPFKEMESNQVMLARLKRHGYVRYEDLALETRDGRHIAVEFVSNMYQAGDGDVIQCNIRDITERKNAEIVAIRLAAIVESSDDAIIGKDLNSIITSWNKGAEKIFGYTAGEMLGSSIRRLIPADRQHEESQILDRVRRGESVEHFETVRQTKDGRLIDVSVTASPIKDASGRIIGVSKLAHDTTERKQAETTLQASEGRYRTLFEYAPAGIVIANPESVYIDANASICRMLGYSRAELIGMHASKIVAHTEIPHNHSAPDAIKPKSVYHREWQFRRKDGSSFKAEVTATLMPDGSLLEMIRDITGRKQVEEQIRQLHEDLQGHARELEQRVAERTAQLQTANEELEAFSYSVSHDLRAPLRHIMGFVDLLQKDAGPVLAEKNLARLTTIFQAAKRMGHLIDDLLAFSRVGRATLQKANINLDELVREALGDLQADTKERNIIWEIHPLPAVPADRALLRLVLINLISNAMKFTSGRAQAKIEIGCASRDDGEAVIFIRDNGAGFDPRYADKLFGVFQRLHSQDEFEGTGIGLANVQRIIHRHGGRAWAEGVVDGGATFYISIPTPNGSADGH